MQRRQFLFSGLAAAAAPAVRPNIVLILADDMGFSDVGCYGSEIETPNIDALARRGVRFTQFYNAARCCPTRASLLTGRYPHQAGVGHMVEDWQKPGYRGSLNPECRTLAQVLTGAGYRSTMAGKWHVCPASEKHRQNWPLQRGFARFFGSMAGGGNYFKPGPLMDGNQNVGLLDGYYTDMLGEWSAKFIRESAASGQPFFHYAAFTAPHWPLQAPAEEVRRFEERYRKGWDAIRQARHERQVKMGLIDPKWKLAPRDPAVLEWAAEQDKDWQASRMAVHAAMVSSLDRNVGRIVDAVGQAGQLDNTLFLFLSDNGASAEILKERRAGVWTPEANKPGGNVRGVSPGPAWSYASYGPDWAHVSNTPFRRHKMWVHEGGISTPLIAAWGKRLKGGALQRETGHIIDVMPTVAEVAGAAAPAGGEGSSLLPLMQGQRRTLHESLGWEHEGNRAVRAGDWKLVAERGKPWELYNLKEDRTETRDLAASESARVKEMTERYQGWAQRCQVEPWETVRPARSGANAAAD
ncbi:MAG: arylsulfatase [Acidobacteria bacterium]|nr:arylsulfatase [Acidobacteriota bacterium]